MNWKKYVNMHLMVRVGFMVILFLLAAFFGWMSDLAEAAHLEATGSKYSTSGVETVMFLGAIGSLICLLFFGMMTFFDWTDGKLGDD